MSQTAQGSSSQGLVINVTYDSSVSTAPAGFKTAVNAAVQFLEATITNSVTVNINFGWGEVGGDPLDAGAIGESGSAGALYGYGQVKTALAAAATSADDAASLAALPAADPTGGGSFYVANAEAKALGLTGATGTGNDGSVGLNGMFSYSFDPNNRAVAGEYDAIGVLEHEMTEVMGRSGSLGSAFGPNVYTPLDLFRYAAPGARDLTPGPGDFSVDGQTMLLAYNDPTDGGDAADWASSVTGDSFGDGTAGVAGLVSATDLREMDVIGYTLANTATTTTTATTLTGVLLSPASADLGIGKTVTITLQLSGAATVTGAPSLGLSDGGTATYLSGSGSSALVFSDTVAATDKPVTALSVASVNLNGGTVVDGAGAAVTLAVAGIAQSGPQIDSAAPTITAVVQSPSAGTLTFGGTVTLTVSMSEAVTVLGSPILTMNDGGAANYGGGSGSSTLVFNYTVGSRDTDVAALAAVALGLNGGAITDAAGNAAVLAVSGLTQTGPAVSTDQPLPVITGTVAGQLVNDHAAITPFAGVNVSDANAAQNETVTVTLAKATDGTLSNLGIGSYNANAGTYTVTGTAALVTATIDTLVFTPAQGLATRGMPYTSGLTLKATDTAGQTATDATTTAIIRTAGAPDDFNGTGVSDVFFQNVNSGVLLSWQVTNGAYGGSTAIAGAAAGWSAIGTGDFNGDGSTDILFQNSASGQLLDWELKGGAYWKSVPIAGLAPGWKELGTGDFNGDGTTDILFQNSASGLLLDWTMKDGAYAGATPIAGAASDWTYVATGDFNGDGTSDILFQNLNSGLLLDWQMANGGFVKSIPIAGASAGWKVVGTGDFNGDGTTDILFQNSNSGLVLDWQMANGVLSKSVAIAGASADWKIVGTGDYNGDGTTDILFQNSNSGLVLYWQIQANAFVKAVPIAGAASDWTIH